MRTRGPARGMTMQQIRRLPAAIDVSTAADALGMSRSTLYMAIRGGYADVQVIRVNKRMKVLTATLISLLEGDRAA
jgi:hypothetical protein